VEGAGKTTQARLLASALTARGLEVLLTREPGGTELGAAIRQLLLDRRHHPVAHAELFLILADRAQHVAEVIRPALAAGKVVVTDRFTDSTHAYQAAGRGIEADLVRRAVDAATGGLKPDLTFLLDLPAARALERVGSRGGASDRLEAETASFHQRVQEGYRRELELEPGRIKIVSATADPETVHRNILSQVLAALAAGGVPLPHPPPR
jgi:dTMP kinase